MQSGHNIQMTEPDRVADEIRCVLTDFVRGEIKLKKIGPLGKRYMTVR